MFYQCFLLTYRKLLTMDTNPQPTAAPILDMPPPPTGIFGTRIPSAVTLAAAVLLFLLPFAEIRCNNTSLMENSGLGIAMGKDWKVSENSVLKGLGGAPGSSEYGSTKRSPNVYAIIALALGLTALVLSIPSARSAAGIAMTTSALAALALIGLWIDLKRDANSLTGDQEKAANVGLDKISISLQMTPWFYVSVVAFLVAAFFCFRRTQVLKR
jgi:hypothetical protein